MRAGMDIADAFAHSRIVRRNEHAKQFLAIPVCDVDISVRGDGSQRGGVSPRSEFWRTLAIHDRTRHGYVRKFLTIRSAAQHQSAAAHVASTDKVRRKSQALAKVG